MLTEKLKNIIRDIPDFPKPGIVFKDITPILHHQNLCSDILDTFANHYSTKKIDAVVGIESRGFLFGFALANRLNVPFVLARKAGKLPYKTISYEYELEYGNATIEMQVDDIQKGWNVLIHDDLLATGGTADATANLIKMQNGSIVGFSFIVELDFLNGKEKLKKHSNEIMSLVHF